MLSEEKIKKMIRLSGYENGLGSVDLRRTRYMKMDYVRLQVIKTVLSVIVAGCLLSLFLFITGCIFTCMRASRLYAESMERVKEYDETLHDLLELYDEEQGQEGKQA